MASEQQWTSILYRALAFLHAATGEDGMRNFMGYDRRWLDEPHVGDHIGRAVWALGEILATAWIDALVVPTRDLLARMIRPLAGDVWLRTAAYTVLGLSRLDADRLEPEARQLLERLTEQLAEAYRRTATEDWRWFEDKLTYDNARLSQALIVGGEALDRSDLIELGLESLRWLGDECGLAQGTLRLPGHDGRRRGEPAPGDGDEQPLDAAALVEAELAAFAVTHKAEHGIRATSAFEWFLGRNRLQKPLYDFATGGCSDGLGTEAVNVNEGAESTLAFHRAALLLDAAGVRATTPETRVELPRRLQAAARSAATSSAELTLAAPTQRSAGTVGQIDRAVGQRYRALHEDDVVDVADALPRQLRAHDRLGQERLDATGLVIEQRDLDRVLRVRVALVVEEQQPVVDRDRRRARADAERTGRRPDDRVPLELAHVLVPVVGARVAQLVERVEQRELHVRDGSGG